MKPIIILTIIITLFSCSPGEGQKSNKRWAYSLFKLGSGKTETLQQLRSYISLGGLKQLDDENCYWSGILDSYNYYYAPIFTFPPGDTICSEMQLLFFDDLHDAESYINNFTTGIIPMNLMMNDANRVLSKSLNDKIIKEITEDHGKYDNQDTINLNDLDLIRTSWRNKNGVDILVDYRYNKNMQSRFSGNSSLLVTYKYTNDLMKQIFNRPNGF